MGTRVPGQRADAAGDGRPRPPPVPGQLVAEPRLRRIRARRRSASPTTASSSRSSGRRSTARPSRARPCRSSTTSSGSSRPSPTASAASTPERSRRPRSPSTSTSRPPPTTSGCGSPSASPTSPACCSSTPQDEQALLSWQSGVYYADGTPKASFWAVRDSLDRTRGGSITRCDGLALDVVAHERPLPRPARVRERDAGHALPVHARLRMGAQGDADDHGRRRRHRARLRPLRPDARRVAPRPQARLGPGAALADRDAGGEPRRHRHPGERRAATGVTQGAPTE